MTTRTLTITAVFLVSFISAFLGFSKNKTTDKEPANKSFQDIIKSYVFVNDFTQKPGERNISEHIFWRYPLKIPKKQFQIYEQLDPNTEFPSSVGSGIEYQHINLGRKFYLENDLKAAKETWLSLRARYGNTHPMHRRNDYFLGYVFIRMALEYQKSRNVDSMESNVKAIFANAATFLGWAFLYKQDTHDPLVDQVTSKGLYNLAAILYQYERYAGAYGAAAKGIDFLRKTGGTDFRSQLHGILAELYILNRSYLDAIQELDTAIRQETDGKLAASYLARAGDIYFDLNNYEFAEYAYDLANKVDYEMQKINPEQFVLRGEALFWLGKFSEAQKAFHYALRTMGNQNVVKSLTEEYSGYAGLRMGDAYLAQNQLENAKLAYFKVAHEHRNSAAGVIAKIRSACLELPAFDGNNVKHARELLEEVKANKIPLSEPAVELGWACLVSSYTDRERTPEMLERVRKFAEQYPESRFLNKYADPVKEVQSKQFNDYFNKGEFYNALSFFELNRQVLFKIIPELMRQRLYVLYLDAYKSIEAQEFWAAYNAMPDTDLKKIRQATHAAELVDLSAKPKWKNLNKQLAQELVKRQWTIEYNEKLAQYISRILAISTANVHLPWLVNLANYLTSKDQSLICQLTYPLLSKMNQQVSLSAQRRNQLLNDINHTVDSYGKELLATDDSCAVSFLELEQEANQKQLAVLADKYLARKDWPIKQPYVSLIWTLAEKLKADKKIEKTKQLLEFLTKNGSDTYPEVRYAKSSLTPFTTEFDSLWQN